MRLATRGAWLGVVMGLGAEGCAQSVPPSASARVEAPPMANVADAGATDAAGDVVDAGALATLDALATRAPSLAAGMREIARGEITANPAGVAEVIARADDRDVCVRVTLVTQRGVHASLTDARGDVLADARDAVDATLGARGPVCVRKGGVVTLRVEASAPTGARFVAWGSP